MNPLAHSSIGDRGEGGRYFLDLPVDTRLDLRDLMGEMEPPEEHAVMKARDVTFICDWTLPILIQAALSLFGVGLHFWTVIRAFRLGAGVILSSATLFLPGVSEIAVGVVSCRIGRWGHPYCLALLSYGGLMLVNWLGLVLLSDSADSEA